MSCNAFSTSITQTNQSGKLGRIPVFYTPQMVADADSFSPSASKPTTVVESWIKLGIPMDIIAPEPVTAEDLARAHLPAYVEAVLSCRVANGFGNRSEAVAKSLPFTSGAMLAAARAAIRNGRVAVAPCSGFHHAGYSHGAGYCTFNGLMVTAMALHASGEARRVGILDFDQHYGDGTDHIIDRLCIDWINHFSAGQHYHFPVEAKRFLASIPDLVAGMKDCDVILYQAGADPHIDDPLGGWLTTRQLFERDQLVFEAAAELGIPVAWNLAGGYQTPLRKVLEIHDGTMRTCGDIYSQLRAESATSSKP
jgi:acetoin utilization deacetylase AcuC-like enzyme